MSERVRAFAPARRSSSSSGSSSRATGRESVEAVFVREGSDAEIVFLGDARSEAFRDRMTSYAARLEAKIAPNADPGEYRCVRLSAHDRLDDDWDFSEIGKLDLVVRVERAPRRLEVTKSEFLRDGCKE